MVDEVTFRPGSRDDGAWLLGLFDEAVAWMVARGQGEQWGSRPWSEDPTRVARVEGLARGGGLRVAELDDEAVGALVVGARPGHVPPVDRPELYIELLLTSRRYAGREIGSRLVQVAVDEAQAVGRELVRVDCWAGAPTLVAWYRRQGFVPSGTFDVNGWPGQIFTMAITPSPPGETRTTTRSPTPPGSRSRTPRTTRCD
jgi:GNAT superfamily N-acetyltransferase